ncbi:MAG: amidase [Actinomycetota bacterium]
MSDDVLARHDATALAELVRRGEVSPVELTEATIARIEALDGDLNAVIHRRFEQALVEAADPSLPDGPYRGVPMLIKDLWPSSAGDPFHLGNKAMAAAGYVHPTDADIVTRYREAGFVNVGRTNTPELGLVATTEPEAYGATANPWNTAHGAGGSSGGAAAAVAGGMVPAANASDGGGSIRIPAAACGLVGLKPSRGRVPMGPLQEEWSVSVQHVVCHTVRDCAGILDITAIPFPGDGVIAPPPARPYAEEVGADVGRLRIGLLPTSTRSDVRTDPECEQAARETAALLERLGHDVDEAHPSALDSIEDLGDAFMTNWFTNCRRNLTWIESCIGRELTEDDVEPATWLMAQMAGSVTGQQLAAAYGAMAAFRRQMADWWASGYDLLLSPTMAALPPVLGDLVAADDDPTRALRHSLPYAAFTSAFNVTGQPGISLPLAQSESGLPIGVQLVGAYARDDLLIRIAAQLEAEVRWADVRAPMHP